jgi:hypothetical protein
MSGFENYEDVATRIQRFYKKYPEGSVRTVFREFVQVAGKDVVIIEARVYRHPEDRHPGTGTAMELVPLPNGRFPWSSIEVCETSAWGRALASIGLGGQKIATRDEVEAKVAPAVVESQVASEFIGWAKRQKLQRDDLKLALTAMGVSVGNKLPSTVLKTMTDEQIVSLKERLSND